ncbi:phosphoribosylaminoimidazole carboxylase, chloroplastic-like protein isoform X1, partial [Tanacetum coccineum]
TDTPYLLDGYGVLRLLLLSAVVKWFKKVPDGNRVGCWYSRYKVLQQGIQVIIAGVGGATHLPGMVATLTPLPMIRVLVRASALDGLDSLLSIV